MKTLVIVESPAKAKTIAKYLGTGYLVESSIGHIRDLPKTAADVPTEYKSHAWARLGLNIEHEFEPIYVIANEKKDQVAKLRTLLRGVDELILATDDDREGESIAWHLFDVLKPTVPVKRMVFHEITQSAIQAALHNSRTIDTALVEAQESRRALDRLYGFEVSPVLWKKIAPKLSAGRVQSVATRMLVERERERMRFASASWWDIEGLFSAEGEAFPAHLSEIDQQRLASGKDFDSQGQPRSDKVLYLSETEALALVANLQHRMLEVSALEEKPYLQKPYAPFITSSLQQEGARKLGFSASRTMRTAQKLYESGFITYMRTDSPTLSKEAMDAARVQVVDLYGESFLHPTPRLYDSKKAKNAQEAHEAIRPAGASFRTPDTLRNELSSDEYRLYDLIWKRTVASQMADARGMRSQLRLSGTSSQGQQVQFVASGKTITFAGFLRAYVEGSDDPNAALEDREHLLPKVSVGQQIAIEQLQAKVHHTQAPARYTEASLVQTLEAAGIGRPSTYAAIISTIQERGYAVRKNNTLIPTWTAFTTSALLEKYFSKLIDYNFTAQMEHDLDDIASGKQRRVPYLQQFYFGEDGLKHLIASRLEEIDPRATSTIEVPRLAGSDIEVRLGKYGAYLRLGEHSCSLPEELQPDELTLEKALELLSKASDPDRSLGTTPEGQEVLLKSGRFGPYVQAGERTASLFPSDQPEQISLAWALQLLSLPRLVGRLDDVEVWAHNGRFGPYLKRGSDSRNVTEHAQLFSIGLEEAAALFAQPASRNRAAVQHSYTYPDRSTIELRLGRFGLYLTDGELNAYFRKGETPEHCSPEDIRNIFEERGKPPKAKARKTKAASKAAASKAGSKTTGKASSKASSKASASPEAPKPTWEQQRAHLGILPDIEQRLIVAIRDGKRKAEEVAPELGLDINKAKGMVLQISKKLSQASRASLPTSSATDQTSQTTGKTSNKADSSKASASPEAPKPTWEQQRAHVGILSDIEQRLIVAIRDGKRKAEEVAPELGLDINKAKGMVLQISKKLSQAARK